MKYYYIDFSCWTIAAENDKEAYKKARAILVRNAKNGEYPTISSIELADSDVKENMIEVE